MNVFQQIANWFSANILPLLTAGNLTMLLGLLYTSVRGRRATKGNTGISAALSKRLESANAENTHLEAALSVLKDEVLNCKDEQSQALRKLDGIISALQTAYGAQLKSPEALSTINNIFNNVKYSAGKTREDIAANADKVEETLQKALEQVKSATKETKRIVGREEGKNPKIAI